MSEGSKIPKGRVRRSAKLGSIVGMQGARYAGTKATTVARSEEDSKERLEQRHLETAMKMVGALGQMKGAAMKLGQFASFIDTEFIPDEDREVSQEQLAKLRTDAPAMPWEKVKHVLDFLPGHRRSVGAQLRQLLLGDLAVLVGDELGVDEGGELPQLHRRALHLAQGADHLHRRFQVALLEPLLARFLGTNDVCRLRTGVAGALHAGHR